MNRKPGRGKDGPAAYACTNSREWPWFLLTVHKEQGEHLGCGLKARNKPAQRQRGQHKDIFPCIARHNRGHEMHESSHTHTMQILIWSRKHICFVLYRLFWFLRGGNREALLVNVMNCRLLALRWVPMAMARRAVPVLALSSYSI